MHNDVYIDIGSKQLVPNKKLFNLERTALCVSLLLSLRIAAFRYMDDGVFSLDVTIRGELCTYSSAIYVYFLCRSQVCAFVCMLMAG